MKPDADFFAEVRLFSARPRSPDFAAASNVLRPGSNAPDPRDRANPPDCLRVDISELVPDPSFGGCLSPPPGVFGITRERAY